MTDYRAVESCCSQVLESSLGLLSTSELVGALRSILANDEDEVVGHALVNFYVLILLRSVCKFLTRFSNV